MPAKCRRHHTQRTNHSNHLSYLKKEPDGTVKLSRTHAHYSQMMTQMGVTQMKWSDFFVYSRHGYDLERIEFDERSGKKWFEV